jgi:hypothetical protein
VAQQGPPPRRPSRDDLNLPGRPAGTGRHGRGSHRAPSVDDRDLPGYEDGGQAGYDTGGQPAYDAGGQPGYDAGRAGHDNGGRPGYDDAGRSGYDDAGRSGYASPPPEYADPRPGYADPRPEHDPQPEYASPQPGYDAPRADYQAPQADYDRPRSDYDRPRSRVAERHSGSDRPARGGRAGRAEREVWDRDPFSDGDESELPPWAGPSIYATRAGGRRMGPPTEQAEADEAGPADVPADGAPPAPAPRRRGRGRAAAARLRKSRRRVQILCGSAILVAVIIAVIAVIVELPSPAPKSSFISTLQPGEFKAVPNACKAVSASLLSQNVPGSAGQVTPSGSGSTSSQCSFTVDHRPVFRVLQVSIQSYQPSLVVAGNGSATAGAGDSYAAAKQALISPPKKSPLPKASVTDVTGLGQEAISALQVLHRGRTVTDLITVVARERNVVVTVSMQAQAKGGGYGPVSATSLASGAQAVARAVMAKAETEPTIKKG